MTPRTHLIKELRKELVGPRDGAREVMPRSQTPSSEYVTGVLVPVAQGEVREADAEGNLGGSEDDHDDDISDGGTTYIPEEVSPALSPKTRPKSLGVSFILQSEETPVISVCATWARYELSDGGWSRQPFALIVKQCEATATHVHRSTEDTGIALKIVSRRVDQDWRVSVFFLNESPIQGQRVREEEMVFQPEIRIRLESGTVLRPMVFRGMVGDPESESQALLYRNRRHFARGHLVGAYWKEVDPERASTINGETNPFRWEGLESLENHQAIEVFRQCDIRTDYLPMYQMAAPNYDWDNAKHTSPNLSAVELSEMWDPKELQSALGPLVVGYQRELDIKQQVELPTISEELQTIAGSNLSRARETLARMQSGLSHLVKDEKLRLAFCFMNKTMDTQRRWAERHSGNPSGLVWRPFQMAFILEAIDGILDPSSPDRQLCDLLWFPTGGGKTEAYLGLATLTIALRRLGVMRPPEGEITNGGTTVLSRYTLRLLTIQQFRRALSCVSVAEMLRIQEHAKMIGWRPKSCDLKSSPLWGGTRFSIGLWVGNGVTPNSLKTYSSGPSRRIAGAIDILAGITTGTHNGLHYEALGDPAQVLECPCCKAILSFNPDGFEVGRKRLYFILRSDGEPHLRETAADPLGAIHIETYSITRNSLSGTFSLRIDIEFMRPVTVGMFEAWFRDQLLASFEEECSSIALSIRRPGYFGRECPLMGERRTVVDFEIRCPNWESCDINKVKWWENVPIPVNSRGGRRLSYEPVFDNVGEPFSLNSQRTLSLGMPIPAYTVDDQIYHRCPTMIVATVDKFARLPFEPRGAAIAGYVTHYHSRIGYYRAGLYPRAYGDDIHPRGFSRNNPLHVKVPRFTPPDLIIQDELHLIQGPLGSMVGIYETLIDTLMNRQMGRTSLLPKVIASTATIRMASEQVASLFGGRSVATFPPPLLDESDSFFSVRNDRHPMESNIPGRLYVGVCCPGRAQTMALTRIWAAMLEAPYQLTASGVSGNQVDVYWTLVGYFNALRELAGTLALYRRDIPDRIGWRYPGLERPLDSGDPLQLSSLASSQRIPSMIERLEQTISSGQAADAVMATSMFGTGVDVSRLGAMIVHGQPKTTSSYIQATGRVGRQTGGLVVTFFPASRPRDLDHYENFLAFHLNLYRHVEPITVAPFSPGALDRSMGPLIVGMLRNAFAIEGVMVDPSWAYETAEEHIGPMRMASRSTDPEVIQIPEIFEHRQLGQPPSRILANESIRNQAERMIDWWHSMVRLSDVEEFRYYESAMLQNPRHSVILGDEHHEVASLRNRRIVTVYKRAPQSLRDVESTTTFGE